VIGGVLHVNRSRVAEPYPLNVGTLQIRRGKLMEDRYALLGDNRGLTSGQVVHAVVGRDQILGKVVRVFRFEHGLFWGDDSVEPVRLSGVRAGLGDDSEGGHGVLGI
jgi:hypothetical protein